MVGSDKRGVVDMDKNDEKLSVRKAFEVDCIIVLASGESNLVLKNGAKVFSPAASSLLKSIECDVEFENLSSFESGNNDVWRWMEINVFIFLQFPIEVSRLDVDLVNFPIESGCESEDSADRGKASN